MSKMSIHRERQETSATSAVTLLFPSLPSPAPSVVCGCSPVTRLDDLAIPQLPYPLEISNTLSPPESVSAVDDPREPTNETSHAESLGVTSKMDMWAQAGPGAPPAVAVSPTQTRHRRPSRTYSRKELIRGTKRDFFEDETNEESDNRPPPAKRANVVGLKNLGNTCYNNAVIQALSHTTPLREFFLDRKLPPESTAVPETGNRQEDVAIQVQMHTARPRTRRAAQLEEQIVQPENINLCNEFSNLLKLMWRDDNTARHDTNGARSRSSGRARSVSVVSPHAFAGAVAAALPLFQERYEQQDAQEFLRCALERMQDELIMERIERNSELGDDIRQTEDTIVKSVFGGVLFNQIVCLACEKFTIKPDPFLDLSLVIPDLPKGINKSNKAVTLEDCIDLFSSAEELERSPSPPPSASSSTNGTGRSCFSCGADGGFSKAFRFGQLPAILCVHLKRFRWKRNMARGGKQKVDTHVKFPLENLDMKRWQGDVGSDSNVTSVYDLYSVVVHQGTGANSGHYVAFVKYEDQWWSLNDDRATKVSPETVAKAKAYLLFYRKRAVDPPPTADE